MNFTPREKVDLTNCDREPIHRPGQIQDFGILIVIDQEGIVRQASANLPTYLGVELLDVVGFPLAQLLTPEARGVILPRMAAPMENGERFFDVPLREGQGMFDVALHMSGAWRILEAERSAGGQVEVTEDLRLLMANFDQAAGFQVFCRLATERLQSILGYDRIMVYRFDEDASGEVIAESARPAIGSFLGQRYPEADIPRQARMLYLRNWLRSIADVNAAPVPIMAQTGEEPSIGLDMSLSTLRAVSPIHLEYLRNMGVSASLSISIIVQGRLWGLFACHHYSPRLVDFRRRTAAELFGQMFSLLLDSRERREEAEHEASARIVQDAIMTRVARSEDAAVGVREALPQIAETIASDGIALVIGGEVTLHGETPAREEFDGLLEFLRSEPRGDVLAEESIARLYPDASSWSDRATGMMMLPLSTVPRDYLIFFRKEYARTVVWGGEPMKLVTIGPHGPRLTPRASFEAWQEVVRGRSAPWTALDRRIAEGLKIGLLDVILRLTHLAEEQQRLASERQKLLIAELNHRVRNILALIAGLVKQANPAESTTEEFARQLEGRINALARAHDQITRDNWGPAPLRGLLRAETAAFETREGERIQLDGPDTLLSPLAFSTLALVVHELATNSAKHGALGSEGGRVSISWKLERGGLSLEWREIGGPPVREPTRRGFGSSFVERAIPFDLHGEARVVFAPSGLQAHFVIPAAHLGAVAAEPAAAEPAAVPGRASGLPRSALVVEDNMIIAMDAQAMLRKIGVPDVVIASRVREALDHLDAHPPDFVLLDLNLGRETSLPIAEELDRRGIFFAFATGYGEGSKMLGRFAEHPVIRKPYAREALQKLLIT
ncbi:HWE histidine kinase domain-containing protein [Roseococcus sp. YIM B11640]|uniref:HWE histidine kinase domain-containing protein n=1 Tax=Roseococcus sp. YIM B11640 TaxID=3133973 RepID=UPI003C7C9D66